MPAEPRPAATVAILREAPGGPEVLLTHRPPTMAFGPGLHVFPGGAVDPGDSDPALLARLRPPLHGDPGGVHGLPFVVTAIREAWEEAGLLFATGRGGGSVSGVERSAPLAVLAEQGDLELRGDWLVPLSRWVTPPVVARRYDARFFTAWLPDGAVAEFDTREVHANEWLTPSAALEAMAAGRIELWMPTSTTLQQLAGVTAARDLWRLVPTGPAGPPDVADVPGSAGAVTRVRTLGGGGVPGTPATTWLVGRHEVVVVDPGDPSDEAADAVLAVAASRGAAIAAVLVSCADPACSAGAEGIALRLGVEVRGPEAAGRLLATVIEPVQVGEVLAFGDASVRVVASGDGRADALWFEIEESGLVLGCGRELRR